MRVNRVLLGVVLAVLLAVPALSGCGGDESAGQSADAAGTGTGTLVFTANGEEYAREGLRSKDGWNVTFTNAYVALAEMRAYQTDPPYETEQGWDIGSKAVVALDDAKLVDLADPMADPVAVGEVELAPSGHYNAIAWTMPRATSGPAEGSVIMLVGQAERDGKVVDFTLRLDRELRYLGGDYVGEERKGILGEGGEADVEMTFHLDHFFGSDEAAADDEMNVNALGFDPLAEIATDGALDVTLADLKQQLSAADFEKIEAFFLHFGHVGEGHAIAEPLN